MKLDRVNRFNEVVVEAGVLASFAILLLSVTGHCNEYGLRVCRLAAQPTRQFLAIHVWQTGIEQADAQRR